MTAFTYRMNAGIPGDVTRHESATVEPNVIDSGTPPTVYGNPVKIVSGKVRPIASGDAAADIYGLLVRPYPTNSSTDGVGTSTPATSGLCDVLKRGYIVATLHGSTAAEKNGVVYVRKANADSTHPVGGIEAAQSGSDLVVMAGAYFTGAADAAGNVEIAFNL